MNVPRYPKYKYSGVASLGEVPQHWKVQSLKRIVSTRVTDGPHETPEFLDEGIPFASAESVSTGRLDFAKIRGFISPQDHERFAKKYKPRRDDIFMVKSGATTGVTAIVDSDVEFNIWSPLAAIRCLPEMNPGFVLNYFRSTNFLDAVTLGWSFGTQQNIGMGVIENLAVPIPPRNEQDAISAFLGCETGKVDALVREQQHLIELLKEKRQAVISRALTKGLNPDARMKDSGIEWLGEVPEQWEVGPIKRFFSVLDGRRIPISAELRADRKGPFPYFGASGIIDWVDEFIFDEDLVLVSEDGANLINRSTPISFVARGRYWVNNHAHILKPIDSFLTFWAERIEAIDLRPFVTGSAQPKLTIEALLNLRIAVPRNEEERGVIQTFIVEQGEKFDNLAAEANRMVDLLQERRTALISATVTGKIDVRGIAKEQIA
jgi:type I restriction enzyme, S subunit